MLPHHCPTPQTQLAWPRWLTDTADTTDTDKRRRVPFSTSSFPGGSSDTEAFRRLFEASKTYVALRHGWPEGASQGIHTETEAASDTERDTSLFHHSYPSVDINFVSRIIKGCAGEQSRCCDDGSSFLASALQDERWRGIRSYRLTLTHGGVGLSTALAGSTGLCHFANALRQLVHFLVRHFLCMQFISPFHRPPRQSRRTPHSA
ncbi:hypothetical protein B0H67DRAFT_313428 [Lasiosphaeris hirsuta]|uniref:Uncharacterized protein n=1 Tax=Lasiosphaeris hirsuta TaxID=260670 RepID=A0AA40A1F2_9PEZI|nr:hypothetical protein B0H67DRAFT_313428 [Lasiosphaeris hirsuta]